MRVWARLAFLTLMALAGVYSAAARAQEAPASPPTQLRTAAAVSRESEQKLHAAFNLLYNLEFATARDLFREVTEAEPASAAARAFWASAFLYEILARQGTLQSQLFVTGNQFIRQRRVAPDPELKRRFHDVVAAAQDLARRRLKKNPQDPDGLFALGLAYGARANYAAGVEGKYVRGVRLGEKAYDAHKKLRRLHPGIGDAGVTLGVHDYVLGSLPRVQRFFLFFLGARGSRPRGLEYLQEAAEGGEFLRGYARVLLAVASLREQQLDRARRLLEGLRIDYPRNPLFPYELARVYRRQQNYPEARQVCRQLVAELAARPHNPRILGPEDAWLELGRVEAAAGDLDAALDSFHRVEEVAEAKEAVLAWALLEQGRIFDRRREREKALAKYDQVIRLSADREVTRLASSYKKKPYRPAPSDWR